MTKNSKTSPPLEDDNPPTYRAASLLITEPELYLLVRALSDLTCRKTIYRPQAQLLLNRLKQTQQDAFGE